ncbi:MAG: hypothetical protein JKY70_03460 [Mucilaginibacter sp.]|nr:hypothetical protein [Mucilaginibacter sp.]
MKKSLTFAVLLLSIAACKQEEAPSPTLQNVPTDLTTTLANNTGPWLVAGTANTNGFTDGVGAAARFESISGIFVAGDGSLYVCDSGNGAVRKISIQNRVTTLKIAPEVFGETEFSQTPYYVAVLNNGTVGIQANANLVLYKDGAVIKTFKHIDISTGQFGGIDTDPTGTFFYITHNYLNLQDNIIKGYLGTIKKNEMSAFTQIADQKTADELHTRSKGTQYTLSNGGLYAITPTGMTRVFADLNTGGIHAVAVNKAGTEIYLSAGDNGDIKRIKNNQLTTIYPNARANGIALANSEKFLYYTSRNNTVVRIPVP